MDDNIIFITITDVDINGTTRKEFWVHSHDTRMAIDFITRKPIFRVMKTLRNECFAQGLKAVFEVD